jgi:hypothetical protein
VLSALKNSTYEDQTMDSSKDAKQLEFNKLEWSTTSFKVSDFLRKFTLPQVVKVMEGFYGDDEDSSPVPFLRNLHWGGKTGKKDEPSRFGERASLKRDFVKL